MRKPKAMETPMGGANKIASPVFKGKAKVKKPKTGLTPFKKGAKY